MSIKYNVPKYYAFQYFPKAVLLFIKNILILKYSKKKKNQLWGLTKTMNLRSIFTYSAHFICEDDLYIR